jgi:tRNA wybutosine-synthesizing protein 1
MKQVIREHRKLVVGFAGNPKSDTTKGAEAQHPNNVAMSLTGEAWMYPHLDELIGQFHQHGFSTVLVTAAGGADNLLKLDNLPNILYVSLISYDSLSYKQLSRPRVGNWSDLLEFCTGASYLETQRVLRITLIRGMNDHEDALAGFVKTFDHFQPHYVEIRSFTPVARASKLGRFRMLHLAEILEFSMKFCNITGSRLALHNNDSQVVLLRTNHAKKELGLGRRALSDTCLGGGESLAQSSFI